MAANTFNYQVKKLDEMKQTLQNVLENYRENPEQIAELLAFKGQFHDYSINNTILIMHQNHFATFVASYQDWQKKGYQVQRGQHGLKVLFPIRTELIPVGEKDGKQQYRRVANATPEEKRLIESGQLKPVSFTRFGVGTVFDIAQTDCPPEDYPKMYNMGYSSEQHAALYQAVKDYARQKGFPVREADLQSISLRGDFNLISKEIRISDKLNDTEKLSTLTHELGHALMHSNLKSMNLPTEVAELEADCISIMLQKYVGIELTESRMNHFVKNYNACKSSKDFKLESILKDVNLAYFNLHREVEPIFDKFVPEKSEEKEQSKDIQQGETNQLKTASPQPEPTTEEPLKQEAEIPVQKPEQKTSETADHPYYHFYFENKYLFTVTGEKAAQEVFDGLTSYVGHLGYSWEDEGRAYKSEQKNAPVSNLFGDDKTKTAYLPFTEKLYQQHIRALDKYFAPEPPTEKHLKKEVCLKDLAVGQRYYDKELDDSWHDDEIKLANAVVNESETYGNTPEYGPGISDAESKKMFANINNHREFVRIDHIYQQDGKAIIDTSCGEIPSEDFLKRINDGKAVLEPDSVPDKKVEAASTAPQKAEKKRSDCKEHDAAVLNFIKNDISIIQLASDMGFTPVKIGGYYSLKEHDSVRIYPDTNSFNQFSSGIGGSTIDFAMNFGGYNKQEAIRTLKEKYVGNRFDISMQPPVPQPVKEAKQAPAPKKFELPEKVDGKYSRAFAYLTKTRCLDPGIVQQCIKDGLLYEDQKHNVVFVGKDADGNAAYATRRSTLTGSNFKCDVAGGRQDIGFFINNHAEKLYICEAPIDALSIMCLMKQQGVPMEHASYLATGGTGKDAALYTRLRENPQIREVVLANDTDTAGWKANKKILERLSKDYPQIQVSRLSPKQGKDINDLLRSRVQSPKIKAKRLEVER